MKANEIDKLSVLVVTEDRKFKKIPLQDLIEYIATRVTCKMLSSYKTRKNR